MESRTFEAVLIRRFFPLVDNRIEKFQLRTPSGPIVMSEPIPAIETAHGESTPSACW